MSGGRRWQIVYALFVLAVGVTGALGVHDAAASGRTGRTGARFAPTRAVNYPLSCGPWQIVSSPNVANSDNHLIAVAALSNANVWAVGNAFALSSQTTTTLIEHWNGSSWTIMPSPSPGESGNGLLGVAYIGSNDIWAVGFQQSQISGQITLIEHWNGSAWSVVPSPNSTTPNASADALYGVAAVSTNNVWAVGSYFDSKAQLWNTLIEHWDGTSWSVVPSPTPQGFGGQLNAVAVVSSGDVWATGADSSDSKGIAEQWNGSTWALVTLPSWTYQYQLQGIAAAAANDVTASGYGMVSNGLFQPMALHWDGTSWTFVNPPALPSNSRFDGIANLPSTHQAFAVGNMTPSSGGEVTLIERWNGTSWVTDSSPTITGSALWAVSADTPLDAWAVGSYTTNGGQALTLVEHYSAFARMIACGA